MPKRSSDASSSDADHSSDSDVKPSNLEDLSSDDHSSPSKPKKAKKSPKKDKEEGNKSKMVMRVSTYSFDTSHG